MYKTLLRSSIFISIIAILFAIYILIYFSNQSNTIIIEPTKYVEILELVHNNPDAYIGKKIITSGYIYIQEYFSDNRFVIAQNVYLDEIPSDEPFIVGFLCENRSDTYATANEAVKIEGIIDKCTYNNSEYPIILVNKIT